MQQNSVQCFDFSAMEPLFELNFQPISNNENLQDLSITSTFSNVFHQDIFEDISYLNFASNQQIDRENLSFFDTKTSLENNIDNNNNRDLLSGNIEDDIFTALDQILEENRLQL